MVNTNAEFHTLMQQVMAGSESAAQELFRDYGPYLLHAIRERMNRRVRSKFDSLDIAQDVWKSFFTPNAPERTFNSPGELIAFLTKLARHKVINVVRQRLHTQKYDVGREVTLDDSTCFSKDDLPDVAQRTPSQVMMSEEEWSEFLRRQPLVYRHIFMHMRDGMPHEEIARQLGINVKTVQRAIGRYLRREPS